MLGALTDKDAGVTAVAGKVLKDSGKLKTEHVPALIDVVKKGNANARKSAVGLLGNLGAASPDAAKAIGEALADEEKPVRKEAVEALGMLGGAGWRAVPELGKLARGQDQELQKAAIRSLGKIGPKAESAVPDLIAHLRDKDLHDDTAAAIVQIGRGSVDHLLEALDRVKDFKERVDIITVLGEIGPDAEDAVKPLKAIVNGNSVPGVRSAATKALQKIEKKKK